PSAASENIVSISCSNCSAGRISHRNTSSSSPGFHHLCAWPGSTTSVSPAVAVWVLPSTLTASVPDSTVNVSAWAGWAGAAATEASGSAFSSISTYSPPVSRDVVTNVIDSPVTGLYRVSPERIMASSWSMEAGGLPPLSTGGSLVVRRPGGNGGIRQVAVRISEPAWSGSPLDGSYGARHWRRAGARAAAAPPGCPDTAPARP